jgi:hypothetical protein
MAVLAIAMWQVRKPDVSMRFVFVVATVTTMLISYHLNPHDLTCLLPVVLLLFAAPVIVSPGARPIAAPGAENRGGMRADVILLVSIYLLFFGSLLWQWLSPWWCLPVLGWIYWKFPHGHAAEVGTRA